MKLWQGWHNTDLGRSYFHYGWHKITRQRDGRVESYMVDIKITRQRMEN